MKLQLAVATEDLNSNLKRAIGIAAGFQVDGVRLNTRTELNVKDASKSALRQTLHFVTERQMKVAGLFCPTRHALYDQEFLEPRIQVIRQSMDLAQKLGTTALLVKCGRIPDPTDDQQPDSKPAKSVDDLANPFTFSQQGSATERTEADDFRLLTEILNDLCEYGNHVGCTLNLILAGYPLDRINAVQAAVKKGPLQFCFDPATAIMTGSSVVDTYRNLYADVGYLRLRDALKDVDGAGTEVALGNGVVPFDELLPTVVDADFEGWSCLERTGGDDRCNDVEQAVKRIRNILPLPSA